MPHWTTTGLWPCTLVVSSSAYYKHLNFIFCYRSSLNNSIGAAFKQYFITDFWHIWQFFYWEFAKNLLFAFINIGFHI